MLFEGAIILKIVSKEKKCKYFMAENFNVISIAVPGFIFFSYYLFIYFYFLLVYFLFIWISQKTSTT